MANIGIVTFTNTLDNYGQVLQGLALQEYLANRGHNVYFLRKFVDKKSRVLRYIHRIKHNICCVFVNRKQSQHEALYDQWRKVVESNESLHPRFFEKFRQKNFKIIVNSDKLLKEKDITCLCIGSDQIWSSVNDFSFLNFGTENMKRIAIAPSIGIISFSDRDKKIISNCLKRFSLVTTRESTGVELCKSVGCDTVKKILDPTFLVGKMVYDKYTDNTIIDSDYLFVYLLGAESEINICDIQLFATENKLHLKYVCSQGRDDDYSNKIYATIPQWLNLLKNSKYVITNSFHGMAMSVIYRKQFLILPVVGATNRMNERIINLADELGLQDRIYNGNINHVLSSIDYSYAINQIYDNKKCLDDLMDQIEL